MKIINYYGFIFTKISLEEYKTLQLSANNITYKFAILDRNTQDNDYMLDTIFHLKQDRIQNY